MKSNGIAVSPPDRAERPGARDYGTKRCLILLQRHDRLPRRPARRKECVQPRTAQTATLRAGQRHCPCSCECIGGPHAKAVKCSEVLFDACRSRSFKIDCRARVVYCRPVTCEHFSDCPPSSESANCCRSSSLDSTYLSGIQRVQQAVQQAWIILDSASCTVLHVLAFDGIADSLVKSHPPFLIKSALVASQAMLFVHLRRHPPWARCTSTVFDELSVSLDYSLSTAPPVNGT